MQNLKMCFILLLACLLSSCSYIYGSDHAVIANRDTDYLKARSIPPLKIPPGLSSKDMQSYYPVSDKQYPGQLVMPSLIPPALYQTTSQNKG